MYQNVNPRLKPRREDCLDPCDLPCFASVGKVGQCAFALALANVERLVRARIDVQVDVVAKPLADIGCDRIDHGFTA